jgi:hypothetical protein
VLALSAAVLGGCATVEIEDHTLATVAVDKPGKGTKTEIAVPPQDAAAVTIAAIESDGFAVHFADFIGDDVRVLMTQGMTAWSGGEVGRVDLRPATDSTTEAYAVVEPLFSAKGAPSVEGKFLPDWKQAIGERLATLDRNRADGAYTPLIVGDRKKGEPFSTSGRGAPLGFLAGGLAGAFVGSDYDARRGARTPWVYRLNAADGTALDVRSFSPARQGACVGLADYDMTPMTAAQVVAANAALADARKAVAEYNPSRNEIEPPAPDPTLGIAVVVTLLAEAC